MTNMWLRINKKKLKIILFKKKHVLHFTLAQRMILNQIKGKILFSRNFQLMGMFLIKTKKIDMKKNHVID